MALNSPLQLSDFEKRWWDAHFVSYFVTTFQIVVAFQGTYEEKILKKYDVAPLQAIGWEGN